MLHLRYHRYRPDAVQQNLVQVHNNQIYDVGGRPASPYEARTAFVVAPERNSFPTNVLRFAVRSDLFVSNAGQQPSTLQVDFGDGRGYVATAWDTPLDVTYGAVGTYDVRFRFGHPDGSFV